MSERGSQPPESEAEKIKAAHRDLVRAYKRLWATEDGRRVLADLECRTNYKKGPYTVGIGHGDLSHRCGTQDPIRHIHEMKDEVLAAIGAKPKRRLATSAAPHP